MPRIILDIDDDEAADLACTIDDMNRSLNAMFEELYDSIEGRTVNDNLSGTGTSQGGATQLLIGKNRATTVTPTDNAFVAPAVGDFIFLNGDASEAAQVFPASGRNLGNGVDAAVSVPAGQSLIHHYFP